MDAAGAVGAYVCSAAGLDLERIFQEKLNNTDRRSEMDKEYLDGFSSKCAELGVDPEAFIKASLEVGDTARTAGGAAAGGLLGGGAGAMAGGGLGVLLALVARKVNVNRIAKLTGGGAGKLKKLMLKEFPNLGGDNIDPRALEGMVRSYGHTGFPMQGAGPIDILGLGGAGAVGGAGLGAVGGAVAGGHMAAPEPRRSGLKDRMVRLMGR
jgi:hypothetical protein